VPTNGGQVPMIGGSSAHYRGSGAHTAAADLVKRPHRHSSIWSGDHITTAPFGQVGQVPIIGGAGANYRGPRCAL